MKERPILFSAPMVRAILEGRKTQTRRVVKPQPDGAFTVGLYHPTMVDRKGEEYAGEEVFGASHVGGEWGIKCPYGKPGDRLWVRETFCSLDRDGFFDSALPRDHRFTLAGISKINGVAFAADSRHDLDSERCRKELGYRWRPSIHMPRWASRITLEVVSVRVERIGDICEDDAKAEGMRPFTKDGKVMKWWPCDPVDGPHKCTWQEMPRCAREALLSLFYVINERAKPDENPWVWVVEFKRVSLPRSAEVIP